MTSFVNLQKNIFIMSVAQGAYSAQRIKAEFSLRLHHNPGARWAITESSEETWNVFFEEGFFFFLTSPIFTRLYLTFIFCDNGPFTSSRRGITEGYNFSIPLPLLKNQTRCAWRDANNWGPLCNNGVYTPSRATSTDVYVPVVRMAELKNIIRVTKLVVKHFLSSSQIPQQMGLDVRTGFRH